MQGPLDLMLSLKAVLGVRSHSTPKVSPEFAERPLAVAEETRARHSDWPYHGLEEGVLAWGLNPFLTWCPLLSFLQLTFFRSSLWEGRLCPPQLICPALASWHACPSSLPHCSSPRGSAPWQAKVSISSRLSPFSVLSKLICFLNT